MSTTLPRLHIEQPSSKDSPKSPIAKSTFRSLSSEEPRFPLLSSGDFATSRARGESQKLLGVLLGELQARPRPPIFRHLYTDRVKEGLNPLANVVDSVRGAAKFPRSAKDGPPAAPTAVMDAGSDEDEPDTDGFSTDAAYNLMCQLRDVLVISAAQGWQIFDDSSVESSSTTTRPSLDISGSVFRLRRSGLSSSIRKTSSSREASQLAASDLLSRCLYVLQSVVSEDCASRVSAPSPLRPPYALQAVTLDVARFIAHTHRNNPRILSQVAFAVLPAFASFPPTLHNRLLQFFEQHIFRGALEHLARIRSGRSDEPTNDPQSGPERSATPPNPGIPLVAIQVEGPDELDQVSSSVGLSSTRAPGQSMRVYYLTSTLPTFLAALANHVNLSALSPLVLQSVQKLLGVMVAAKPDLYLDILEVLAYDTREGGHFATSLLLSFWPKAVGHLTVGQLFPVFSAADLLVPSGDPGISSTQVAQLHRYPYAHQFIAWQFSSSEQHFGNLGSECRVCSTAIHDFGLFCPFCMCAVHFDCYDLPDGCFTLQYSLNLDDDTQRLAIYRFSYILPSGSDDDSNLLRIDQHVFGLANIFTLTLCSVCHNPLWGHVMQGMHCSSCHQFAHAACLAERSVIPPCRTSSVDGRNMEIQWDDLRSSFLQTFSAMNLPEPDLVTRSYEEVAVFHATLWAQLKFLTNGVLMGTISILSERPMTPGGLNEHKVDEFELHHLLRRYEGYLCSGRAPFSAAVYDYVQESRIDTVSEHTFMFDWPFLVYLTSLLKSPQEAAEYSFVHLQVDVEDRVPAQQGYSLESTSLGHIQGSLRSILSILSDRATHLLLGHLIHLGLIQRLDMPLELSKTSLSSSNPDANCAFVLPVGLDPSTDVETLVTAVEVCLSNIDLAMNEVGFLLLVRRLSPNGMASEYGMHRLAKRVLAWIFSEHQSLELIMREYIAEGLVLPGVRSNTAPTPWPNLDTSRPTGSNQNGGDYVASRQLLMRFYATPWLSALQQQFTDFYHGTLFGLTLELVEEEIGDVPNPSNNTEQDPSEAKRMIAVAERSLQYLVRLCHTCVPPSTFNIFFREWLNLISSLPTQHEPLPSLARLLNREAEASHRLSVPLDRAAASDLSESLMFDHWTVILDILQDSSERSTEALAWLRVLSRSGVEIPTPILARFAAIASERQFSMSQTAVLIEACFLTSWLRGSNLGDFQTMVSRIHRRLHPEVIDHLRGSNVTVVLHLIRRSLIVCLLAYGCTRSAILDQGLVEESELQNLPSRRRFNPTHINGQSEDIIVIDSDLLGVLADYAEINDDRISSLIGRFLFCFVTESRMLEAHEVDNSIVRNGSALSRCVWQFYGVQNHDLTAVRISLMLRVLTVDYYPFRQIMKDLFQPNTPWELRFQGVARLFRIILDCTSSLIEAMPSPWRSSALDVFYYFFGALWTDGQEEVRLAVEAWSGTLLAVHFDAISKCWNEALLETTAVEQIKLVNFLIQLQAAFPTWQGLSWTIILQCLHATELKPSYVSEASVLKPDTSENVRPDDPRVGIMESTELRVSLLVLTLQYLAHGVEIDLSLLLTFKRHLATLIGFSNVILMSSSTNRVSFVRYDPTLVTVASTALPCLRSLVLVLDAYHPFDLSPLSMGIRDDDRPHRVLIGSIFVDLVLDILATASLLAQLPVASAKNLLEALIILIHKHDFESKVLRQFHGAIRRALRQTMSLMVSDVNYELRQLVISACHSYFKQWQPYAWNLSIETLETCANLIQSLESQKNEDGLVAQAMATMETVLLAYATKGLGHSLFKRHLPVCFFPTLRRVLDSNARSTIEEPLRIVLLRDTLDRLIADEDETVIQTILGNLSSYVEHVYHEGWSMELMQFLSQSLIPLTRRVMDWSGDAFDPEPLLAMISILLQHNKANSRDLLLYMESALRAILGKFKITAACLSRLLRVSLALQRRKDAVATTEQASLSHLVRAVMEVMSDVLRGKASISFSDTLAVMLEVSIAKHPAPPHNLLYLSSDQLKKLASDALSYLFGVSSQTPEGKVTQGGFVALKAAASVVLLALESDPSLLVRQMAEPSFQAKLSGYFTPIRAWNIMVLTSLSLSPRMAQILFGHFTLFSATYSLALGGSDPQPIHLGDFSPEDINHTFVAVKVWLLLSQRLSQHTGDASDILPPSDDNSASTVWNSLWPPFRRLLDNSEVYAQMDSNATLPVHLWSCVADLFLFLLQSRSALSREALAHVPALTRWAAIHRTESLKKKLSRVLKGISGEPPDELPFDALVSQTSNDVLAAERLHAVVARRRDDGRYASEGARRDGRL